MKLSKRMKNGLTKIDIDTALEEFAKHTDNFRTQARALSNGMTDCELDHVVRPRQQSDHVVEDTWTLYVGAVFKVELLRLVVFLVERSSEKASGTILFGISIGKSHIGKDILLLILGEVPEDNYSIEHCLAGPGGFENRSTSYTVAIGAVEQRQGINDVETIVVDLCLGLMSLSQELGSRLDLVGLRSAVGCQSADLIRSLHLGQPLSKTLAANSTPFLQHIQLFIFKRAILIIVYEPREHRFALNFLIDVVVIVVCFRKEDQFLAYLGRSGRYLLASTRLSIR
ncbi:hypothetical protein HG530_011196 [Fusarium avenaceum]|nr:hypothetical protein HG530_011196 [Fusarium avenaceum]